MPPPNPLSREDRSLEREQQTGACDLIGLRGIRVIDFSTEIAGPYCGKLLVDAGAEVIKIEPQGGDPMRHWSATGAELGEEDGALFRFLNAGKESIVAEPEDPAMLDWIASADLVIDDFETDRLAPLGLPRRFPSLVHLSITPYGRTGPWAARPASEFVIQAESGSIGSRGIPGQEPFQAGGRISEWIAGTFASVAALAAVRRAQATGHGETVDFSLLEVMAYASSNFIDLAFRLLGLRGVTGSAQSVETPSIEPTRDGYVGFCTNTAQQFSDFLLLIERPDLREDKSLLHVQGRTRRLAEWNEIVHAHTRSHSTREIIESASLLRIPVAPVNDGETVRNHEQLEARGVFVRDATDSFDQPRRPYMIDGETPPPPRPAPKLNEHTGAPGPRERRAIATSGPPELPLAGLRVLDLTAWWAGPSASHMLATLGADVIHLESIQRPDGMRMTGGALKGKKEHWWEYSAFYLSVNANKRGLTLNLNDPKGAELARRLIRDADAIVENFTPRVLDNFGLDWETVHSINPRTILVRMPAFGLTGPWRDNTGFAQTMEQMTGLAWLTGHADDQPRIQRGPCDPLAGMHAAFALLVALAEREATGVGRHVEVTMVEAALNAAAEIVIEYSAYGNKLGREGNRSPVAAPQGLYPCLGSTPGDEFWLALSVTSDAQWRALVQLLGAPDWCSDPGLEHHAGRRDAHDRIDAELSRWAAQRKREQLIAELIAAGIPAGSVCNPREQTAHPQLRARGFFEEVEHPVVGRQPIPTVPFRYAGLDRWIRRPAPRLGEHNREILGDELGLDESEIEELEAEGVIGERPEGLS